MKNSVYVIGMGPGNEDMMTMEALAALERSDVIVGYTVYIKLLGERFADKTLLTTPMRQEEERCRLCFAEAAKGHKVSLICSGDAGIYGLASLMYEVGKEYPDTEVVVIPGITAASSGAAVLGAPLNHDFCVISLSDRLTPWEMIEKRLACAAMGDFCVALYNPSSKGRPDYLQKAVRILLQNGKGAGTLCGVVRSIGRTGQQSSQMTLAELEHTTVDMFTTVFIGNSATHQVSGWMVTPRGYHGV